MRSSATTKQMRQKDRQAPVPSLRATMATKNNGNGRPPFLSDAEIAAHLSMQYRIPTVELDAFEIERHVLALVSRELCEAYQLIPVSIAGQALIVAVVDPTNADAIAALKVHTGYVIEPVITTAAALRAAIEKYYAR